MEQRSRNTGSEHFYTVGEICTRTGITRKTLFYYDRIGLLKPDARVGSQEHKVYSRDSVKRLEQILAWKNAGLTLQEIREILDASDVLQKEILSSALQRLQEEKQQIEEALCKVQKLLQVLQEEH